MDFLIKKEDIIFRGDYLFLAKDIDVPLFSLPIEGTKRDFAINGISWLNYCKRVRCSSSCNNSLGISTTTCWYVADYDTDKFVAGASSSWLYSWNELAKENIFDEYNSYDFYEKVRNLLAFWGYNNQKAKQGIDMFKQTVEEIKNHIINRAYLKEHS